MEKIAEILGVPKEKLEELDKAMSEKGFEPAIEKVTKENEELVQRALEGLGVKGGLPGQGNVENVFTALTKKNRRGRGSAVQIYWHFSRKHRFSKSGRCCA